jgi:hypothetical protein
MQKFQFFTASPLKMRACGTGRKFAEYDQGPDCKVWPARGSPRRNFSWISVLQNLHVFDELMIYFVSYLLGLARENSENAISDHLDTPNFLKCSAFIFRATAIYDEKFPAQK